ncbi:hypothetical protein SAMN05421837_1011359 [Amycolatopsis pretoriensis]|uniref:Uncharacterized protein n=2 Tax=Amycolatopsis pretoriensis TaxID=218821 RepID=A0A1H5Q946_9PSEU|nr:hypothetical protein SAMN05421837_1011359 [Amycolatopsis pretoriensis]
MEAEELPVPDTRPEPVRAMNAEVATSPEPGTDETTGPAGPPTVPSSVVWCCGRPYVLEARPGRARWMGTDYRGRPEALSSAELQRRGWSRRRAC